MRLRTRFEWLPDLLTVFRALTGRRISAAPGDAAYSLAELMAWAGETMDALVYRAIDRLLHPAGADLDAAVADLPMSGRRAASKARCNVVFVLDANAALPVTVPAGTKVRAGSSGPVYATAVGALLETTGIIACEAAAAGSAYRAAAGDINALVSAVTGIASVYNPQDSTGGLDAETDAQLLARRTALWDALAKATPAAYELAALSVAGVSSAGLLEDWPALGEATLSVCGGNGAADAAMLAAVQTALETGGPANAPGYRAAGVTVHVNAPRRLLLNLTLRILMEQGAALGDYAADIQAAAASAMSAYGIGARLPLSSVGKAIEASVDAVKAVAGVSGESIGMPFLLPVRILSVGGVALATSLWEWDYTNTRIRWAGGPWINAAQLSGAAVMFYSADGKSSVTAAVEFYVSGGSWPRYSLEEETERARLGELTQLEKNQAFVLGNVSVINAAPVSAAGSTA